MDGKRLMMAAATVLVLAGTACAGGQGGSADSAGEGAPARGLEEPAAGAPDVAVEGEAAGLPELGPSVIKTAELELEIERDGLGDAVGKVTAAAARHGGFVLSSTVAGNPATSATVVLRVPSKRFEAALAQLRGLGTPEREHVAGEEVGQEFVDLEARLRNLRSQEAVLLRLMDEATTVQDTIRVQNELQRVQLEVEQIEGRLRYLRDQTDLGTISVLLTEEGAPQAAGAFGGAWDTAVEVFLAVLSAVIVAAGFAIPVLVLAGLAWVGYRRLRPRLTSP
ncbi:MAG: DUF4349 domain-containing protein [Actinomycetota bacterium]